MEMETEASFQAAYGERGDERISSRMVTWNKYYMTRAHF